MSKNPKHQASRGPKPQRPPLCCVHCGTDSHLFISSIAPSSPVSANPVRISYTCTRCGVSYCRLADVTEFAGVLNVNAGSQDVLVFSGQYIHCRRSMQETASGVLRLDGRTADEESGKPLDVYLDIRVMECPCGFRLVLPD
jgi:hypothetical protein